MSRSNYTDDYEYIDLYRNSVRYALTGKRGRAFLQELARAMDKMPTKILITNELINEDGDCCAIGVVCKSRGLDISKIDCDKPDEVAKVVNVARCMAAEIAYENDECGSYQETPEKRWHRMRRWVNEQLNEK